MKSWPWAALTLLAIGAAALWRLDITAADLAELGGMPRYLSRFAQPDFRALPDLTRAAGETFVMGLWGTGLALISALALLLPASEIGGAPAWMRAALWGWLSFVRAVPDPIFALALSLAFGVGPWPGALALALHGSGFFTKVLAESVDRLPLGALDGVRSAGAGPIGLARFAAWPLISREIVGYSLYMLDRNVRVAATLGLVGAGGLGYELQQSIGLREFSRASAVLIVIAVLILVIDLASGLIRRRLAR
jgi:phosphonate transport system permease protein